MQIRTSGGNTPTGWILLYAHNHETLFGYTQDATVLDTWLKTANCNRAKNHYSAELITDSGMISQLKALGELAFDSTTIVDNDGQLVNVLDI